MKPVPKNHQSAAKHPFFESYFLGRVFYLLRRYAMILEHYLPVVVIPILVELSIFSELHEIFE